MSITLKKWLQQQPFSLAMSSGFFGFFAHCGVTTYLEEQNLFPKSVSGSSAGALITGCWAAGVAAEDMKEHLFSLKREDFWDPGVGLGLLRGKLFDKRLRTFIPTTSFAECRFTLFISAYHAILQKTSVLSKGDIVKSIRASCAVPVMFQPVWINAQPFLDGGIRDHGGLKGLKREKRIFYHHLLPRNHNNKKRFIDKIPHKDGMVTLVLTSLPKVGPYRLENGPHAYQHAYQKIQKAMDMPIGNGKIVL